MEAAPKRKSVLPLSSSGDSTEGTCPPPSFTAHRATIPHARIRIVFTRRASVASPADLLFPTLCPWWLFPPHIPPYLLLANLARRRDRHLCVCMCIMCVYRRTLGFPGKMAGFHIGVKGERRRRNRRADGASLVGDNHKRPQLNLFIWIALLILVLLA